MSLVSQLLNELRLRLIAMTHMQHTISINRRLDLSGHPWELLINGAPMSLSDNVPTRRQIDQQTQRFDRLSKDQRDRLILMKA